MSATEKPLWNSLEITKLCVGALTPILIFSLGITASRINDDNNIRKKKEADEAQYTKLKAEADDSRDRDITKEYIKLLLDKDSCNKLPVASLLISMSTPPQSEKLQKHFLEYCQASPNIKDVQAVVATAASQSVGNEIGALIQSLKTDERHSAREQLKYLFNKNNREVSDFFIESINKHFTNYRVTLGILKVLSDPSVGQQAEDILMNEVKKLAKSPNMKDPTFSSLYAQAIENQSKK